MPAYLIVYTERRGDDTVLEDDELTLELDANWAVFYDTHGICFTSPRERISSIQRVDPQQDPEDQEPAPQKE